MNEKHRSSFAPQRRKENLRNSEELGDLDIFHLPKERRGLAGRLVSFTRLLDPKLAARIFIGMGLDIIGNLNEYKDNTPED